MSRSSKGLLSIAVAIAAAFAVVVGFSTSEACSPAIASATPASNDEMPAAAPAIAESRVLESLDAAPTSRSLVDTRGANQQSSATSGGTQLWGEEFGVFHAQRPAACTIRGVVVDRDGKPIEAAEVRTMWFVERTRADGTFETSVHDDVCKFIRAEHALVARKDGYMPALVENFGARVLESRGGTLFERLVLGEPLTISGHVVDRDGHRVARGRVRIVDGTPLEPQSLNARTVEPASQAFDTSAGFSIGGLFARDYVLEFELHQPLATFRTAPIAAGSNDLEIVIPSGALIETVHGYLLTSDGSSLAGASMDVAFQFAPSTWWPKRSQVGGGAPIKTDRAGEFELRDVPDKNGWVVVEHPSVPPQAIPLAGLDLRREITLLARRRARVQLEKFDESWSEVTLDLLEPSGSPTLWEAIPGATAPFTGAPVTLERGRSKAMTSLEGKFTLLVRKERAEVLRREIELLPERTTFVTP